MAGHSWPGGLSGAQDQREGAQQIREQPRHSRRGSSKSAWFPELKPQHVVHARERRPQRRPVNLPGCRAAHRQHPPPVRPRACPDRPSSSQARCLSCLGPSANSTEAAPPSGPQAITSSSPSRGTGAGPRSSSHCSATSAPRPRACPVDLHGSFRLGLRHG